MISSADPEDQPPKIPPHASTVSMALNRIAKFCVSRLPKDWGFAILAFPFDGSSGVRYVSNGTRKDVAKLLRSFVEKHDASGPTTKTEVPPSVSDQSGEAGNPGN